MQEDGAGGLASVAFCAEEDRADGIGNPFWSGQEELAFGFTFYDEEAIQTEVVDIDSVGQVAP